MEFRKTRTWLGVGGAALGIAWIARLRRERRFGQSRPVVLITGGARGLGFALAREWASRGARLSICARNRDELGRAQRVLSAEGGEVATFVCDVTQSPDVDRWLKESLLRFGRIDVLVNNAGVIQVGPAAEWNDEEAYFPAIDTNLKGMIRATLTALPYLKPGARIVNITSIGAAVPVPHLLTYSTSKFGALGFSLGLGTEIRGRGISVTTILPGLMRTGSAIQAEFRGDHAREFRWFSIGAGLPGISISAEKAAREIVSSALARRRFVVLGIAAKALRLSFALFPNSTLGVLGAVNRILLPSPPSRAILSERPRPTRPGKEIGRGFFLGRLAEKRLNERAG